MNQFTIKREFGDLAYFTSGSGPYLLGLSGFGCTHYNFIDLVPHLAKNFTVVLIDNRGVGKSSATNADYKMSDLAADALAVMDHLNAKSFGVMGISMGGFIAQELVKLAPKRVSALSLLCSTSGPPTFHHEKTLVESDLRAFEAWDKLTQAEFMTKGTTHPTLMTKSPGTFQRIVNLRVENAVDIEEKVRQNRAAVEFLKTPFDLSVIQCPTYTLAGAEDRFLSPEFPAMFKTVIPQAVTELIPETDHFFFLEKPDMVGPKLNNFFQGKII